MQFIFFLLSLFLIACVFYGVYAGVRTIVCSTARIAGISFEKKPSVEVQSTVFESYFLPSTPKNCIDELQALFELYQCGALTKEEFDQVKKIFLSSVNNF